MSNLSFDINKPVMTRSGRPARVVCTDFKKKNDLFFGVLVTHLNGDESFRYYRADGTGPFLNEDEELVQAKNIRFEYANVYQQNLSASLGSRESRNQIANAIKKTNNRIGVVKFKFEDDTLVSVELEKK